MNEVNDALSRHDLDALSVMINARRDGRDPFWSAYAHKDGVCGGCNAASARAAIEGAIANLKRKIAA